MHDLSNQVVLVTGAGWSPGPQVALAFSARGARVAVSDLTPVNLDGIAAEIRAAGGLSEVHTADLSSKIQAQTMAAAILEQWGRIDVLAAIIGVRPRAPILELDEWDWRKALDMNLTGPFLMTQLAGRVMRELGGGSILYIADTEGHGRASEERAAYAAGRSGLMGLTQAASAELAVHRIRVNAILQGARGDMPTGALPEIESLLAGAGTIAETAIRLCSADADLITGQVISIR